METHSAFEVSPQSYLTGAAHPSPDLSTSRAAGWRSVYLRHALSRGDCDPYETPPTDDQTLVVVLRGECDLSALAGGRWRTARRGVGSTGMTPGGASSRLRWSAKGASGAFETAHLYMPQAFFRAAVELYRTVGQGCADEPLASLAVDDAAVAGTVVAMVSAMRAGAPNLYAETAAQWLATHLLSRTSPWRDRFGDRRRAGVLTDARLARVVDYIDERLASPLALGVLAAEAGVSRFHFVRLFRKRVGETPVAYLTRRRMELAVRLLTRTDMPIQSVASRCGYGHLSQFDRAFQRWNGCTPSQTRRKHDAP